MEVLNLLNRSEGRSPCAEANFVQLHMQCMQTHYSPPQCVPSGELGHLTGTFLIGSQSEYTESLGKH